MRFGSPRSRRRDPTRRQARPNRLASARGRAGPLARQARARKRHRPERHRRGTAVVVMFSRPRSHPLSRTVTAVAVVAVCLCSCTASPAYPPYKLPTLSIQASSPLLRPPPPAPTVCMSLRLPVRPSGRPSAPLQPTNLFSPSSLHTSFSPSLPAASLRPSVRPFVWGLGRTVAFGAGGQSAVVTRPLQLASPPPPTLAGSRGVAGGHRPAPRAPRPRAKSATRAPRP